MYHGAALIYIGFGSMPIPDLALFSRVMQALLVRTPHRFIFCEGWSRVSDLPRDSRIFVVAAIDQALLFPRCQAAVIHGGVGTLAATKSQ